ncbi:MAG: helix-turn-helix domain-containing protein [Kiritimatiellia bacterium]
MAHSNLVQSVLRALDILLEVGSARQETTLRELGARLNLKTPTLHNLLRTLKARGFVRQIPGQARYMLGPAVFDLVSLRYESSLIAGAEDAVRSLFNATGQKATVTFSELAGGMLQTVLRMSPDLPGVMQRPRQQMLNPYTSATALVLHAFGAEEDKQALCGRNPFQEHAGPFADRPDKYSALLKKIRVQGYALRPLSFPGQLALAAPVFGAGGELFGIIGISRLYPEGIKGGRADEKNMAACLLDAAKHILAKRRLKSDTETGKGG